MKFLLDIDLISIKYIVLTINNSLLLLEVSTRRIVMMNVKILKIFSVKVLAPHYICSVLCI